MDNTTQHSTTQHKARPRGHHALLGGFGDDSSTAVQEKDAGLLKTDSAG
jgi:hypothetical protein